MNWRNLIGAAGFSGRVIASLLTAQAAALAAAPVVDPAPAPADSSTAASKKHGATPVLPNGGPIPPRRQR